MEYDEKELIRRAAKGDANAFNLLLSEHQNKMYRLCLQYCGNREDAQDCLQNAMIRIFKSIQSFKGNSAFSTWVYRITANTCMDELRRRQRKQVEVSADKLSEEGFDAHDTSPTPEQVVITKELNSSLGSLIKQLPDDMRMAILLRDMSNLSYDEIAETLKINVGTVKSRISRAREKLRKEIEAHPELFDRYGVKKA